MNKFTNSKGILMATQIADFNIKFNTDNAAFVRGVDEVTQKLWMSKKSFEAANDQVSTFSQKLNDGADSFKSFGGGIVEIAGGIAAGFGVAAGAAGMLIRSQAEVARELEKMATVAGLTVTEMQSLGYASEQFAIPADKMSDIIKDVNDKLGEFISVGSGGFVDFFNEVAPKVGLTAQELQKLSGTEALIAVKNAMDSANVPMKEQTFYLEAIASDATALMPLLANNGEELKLLTKHYDDLNVSMSEYDIEQFKQLDKELEDTARKLERSFSVAVLGAREQISWLSNEISESVTWWGTLFDSWSDNPRTLDGLVSQISDLSQESKTAQFELSKAETVLQNLNNTWDNSDKGERAKLKFYGFDEQLKNAKDSVSKLSNELDVIQSKINEKQQKYAEMRGLTPPTKTTDVQEYNGNISTGVNQNNNSSISTIDSLDMQYSSELEKLRIHHQNRLDEIENLQLSETEIRRKGYESLAALKQEYTDREKEFQLTQEEEYFLKLDENMQRELDAYSRKEQEKQRIKSKTDKVSIDTQKRFDNEILGMQIGVAQQAVGLIASSAEEGSSLQKAAMIAQQAMAIAQIGINTEVAASRAIAELGIVAGEPKAMQIRIMGGISMALVAAQSIVGMAHSGISDIPSEGTWLLDQGERVYTNDSAKRLDEMYGVIISQSKGFNFNNDFATRYKNDFSNNNQNNSGLPVTVVINEAPSGSHIENIDDEKKIISVMMKDASSSGKYYGYLSQKLGAKSGGYK